MNWQSQHWLDPRCCKWSRTEQIAAVKWLIFKASGLEVNVAHHQNALFAYTVLSGSKKGQSGYQDLTLELMEDYEKHLKLNT